MPHVLVIDVGSSSTRCWLFDRLGRGIDPGPPARVRYRWDIAEGAMAMNADALLKLVGDAVDGALAGAREIGVPIAAVSVTTFWHSLLGLDRNGDAVTPLTGWGDARAAGVATRLAEQVDPLDYHRRTGCYLHASFPAVRLAWLASAEPMLWSDATAWASFGEYLEQQLFGERRCTFSMASGTGLLNAHRLSWDPAALEMAGVAEAALSPLVDHDAPLQGLRAPYAERWPELARIPWFPPVGDGACANLGSGAVGPGKQGITIGTTAAVRVLVEPAGDFEIPDDLWAYRLDARRWVVGGALSNGGNALVFLDRTLRLPAPRAWDEILASTAPDAHGLTVLPSLASERDAMLAMVPGATLAGLRLDTSTQEIVRAWLEAIAYRIAWVSRRLEATFGPASEIIASGGGLQGSHAWAQMLADVLDRPVGLPAQREETSRGAALLTMRALGWLEGKEPPDPVLAERYEPDEDARAHYRAGMKRQAALQEALHRGVPSATAGGGLYAPIEPDES